MKTTHAELHDNKGFAMLHDASAIRSTVWEGMTADASIAYLNGLMNLAEPLLDLGLNSQHLSLVRNAFEDLIAFAKLFKTFPETVDGITVDYKQCIELLHARANMKNGIAYMPSGWIGLPGHFVAVKLQWIKGNVFSVSYLQQGSGTEYHQPMVQCEYKTKYCYQSDPIIIDFDTELGHNFLLGTVTLNHDKRIFTAQKAGRAQVNSYSEIDLYGLLRLSGTPAPKFTPDLRQAVTLQRVGSCALTNAKLVANDVLIFIANFSAKKIKRYTFGLKINSLQVAIDAYAEGKCDEKLLIWALREADVRITKHYPELITAHECIVANQLIPSIKIEHRLVELPLPGLTEDLKDKLVPLQLPTVIKAQNINSSYRKLPYIEKIYKYQLKPDILPRNILAVTKVAIHTLLKNMGIAFRLEYSKFLRSLPKTSGLADDKFWDQVPLDHQSELLKILLIALDSYCTSEKKLFDIYAMEAAFIVYDIAAQLATKHQELRFDNTYALGLSDTMPPDLKFFEPEIYYNLKQIILNFKNRCLGKQVIFTNNISDDNHNDNTLLYLKNKFMTPERRRLISDMLIQKRGLKPDAEIETVPEKKLLFPSLTGFSDHDNLDEFDREHVLGDFYWTVLQINAYAHRLGYKNKVRAAYEFEINNTNLGLHFYFNEKSQFSIDKTILANLDKYEHLPSAPQIDKKAFFDIAENTTAHPLPHLRRLNHSAQNQNLRQSKLPYQHHYSGAFHFDIQPWPKANNNLRLESLDEEFRRIEATGNMKIIVLLEWLLTHLAELELEAVRNRLEELLFSFGQLDYVLTSHTEETLRLLNMFLDLAFHQTIDNLRHDDDSTQIQLFQFFCSVQFELSRYIAIVSNLYNLNIQSFKPVDLPKQSRC